MFAKATFYYPANTLLLFAFSLSTKSTNPRVFAYSDEAVLQC